MSDRIFSLNTPFWEFTPDTLKLGMDKTFPNNDVPASGIGYPPLCPKHSTKSHQQACLQALEDGLAKTVKKREADLELGDLIACSTMNTMTVIVHQFPRLLLFLDLQLSGGQPAVQ